MFNNAPLTPFDRIGATANSLGTAVASSASANTKGAWVELSPATPRNASAVGLMWRFIFGTKRGLLDLGIGAAGSEVSILDNLPAGLGNRNCGHLLLPLHIQAGQRVAARYQVSAAVADTINLSALLYSGSELAAKGSGRLTTLGADTANTTGVVVTAAGSINTKGAWAEISASCPSDFRGFWVCLTNPVTPPGGSNQFALVDIGVGAGGSEQVIVPDLFFRYTGTGIGFPFRYIPLHIKAGARIAARLQLDVTVSGALGVLIIGEG